MSDLKIPNLNKNSDKYLFKKKLSLRRKSKGKLIKETFLMLALSIFLIYLNYLIPGKKIIFNNFQNNLVKSYETFWVLISYMYEIMLIMIIVISLFIVAVLLIGAFLRILKIAKRKSRKIPFN